MRTYLVNWLGVGDLLNLYLGLFRRVRRLESRMTAYDDMLGRLNEATNEVASDLADLKNALANNDLSSADAAARLEPLVSRLEGMGADANDVDPGGTTDPTTTTDPTNSPTSDEAAVNVDDEGNAVDSDQVTPLTDSEGNVL